MGIRFSMKWLLAAMVYAALAAMAFSQTGWAWADLLWLASFLAVCYAATLAFIARGERQGRAVGFFTASLALLVAIQSAPDAVPIGRIVEALSPAPTITFPPQIYSSPPSGQTARFTQTFPAYSSPVGVQGTLMVAPYAPALPPALPNSNIVLRTRAANAVGAMLAGLAGSVLGALAYRRTRPAPAPA